MKLIFPESQLTKALDKIRDNPTATGLLVTHAELNAMYDELLATGNSQCVLISGNDKKLHVDGRWIEIKVETK